LGGRAGGGSYFGVVKLLHPLKNEGKVYNPGDNDKNGAIISLEFTREKEGSLVKWYRTGYDLLCTNKQ